MQSGALEAYILGVTTNGATIRALREARNWSLRALAKQTRLNHSYLSRLERDLARASEETATRIAQVFEVPLTSITQGETVSTATITAETQRVPAPGTEAGAYYPYTPEQAAEWLPMSARVLREKAYKREIPHNTGGSRITFTGLNIREISDMYAVRPISELKSRKPAA